MKITHTFLKNLLVGTLTVSLCACSNFFDKDNTPNPTPLTHITEEMTPHLMWYSNVNYGVGNDYLKYVPVVTDDAVITAGRKGNVTATNKANGKTLWSIYLNKPLSAGPAVSNEKVFIGTRDGKVVALNEKTGGALWQASVSSEVLAPPAAANGVVIVKAIDGQVSALSATDGHALWHFQQNEPALILRSGSAPEIYGNTAIIGFANGSLAKLTLHEGGLLWQQTIALPQGSFAIERMVDIDADPLVYKNQIYVATYQGKISVLELSTGKELWSHDLSSFTGLTADPVKVFVTDAKSYLWAFEDGTGTVDWRQTRLAARNITAPAAMGNYIIVGDEEGYLHWVSKQDGHFVARTRVNHSGILAAPVVNNNVAYILTKDGHLAAYTLA
ncbi:MAG: outer membrane protein assembly factor BamB [Gammaproteobacteria bacterium]|nr:outer membrane protein assembly factor BamB [Gammaproteobacteria bacterium]